MLVSGTARMFVSRPFFPASTLGRRTSRSVTSPSGKSPEELARLANGVRLIALYALGDAEAARDVAQETMTRVLDALSRGQVRDVAKLAAFARGIAQHVIADVQRAQSRIGVLSDDVADQCHAHPLDTIVAGEEHSAIHSALAHLSRDDRELLRLVFVEGLTPGDIAARLREPPERVRKRKSRALERLREHFFRIARPDGSGASYDAGHVSPARPTLDQRRRQPLFSQRGEA